MLSMILTPLDLISLPIDYSLSLDAKKKAKFVKSIQAKVHEHIEMKNEIVVSKKYNGRKRGTFELGDWVWVHLRKKRFPNLQKGKLDSRGDG